MFQHILVPLDGSAEAERAVAVAARLAQATGGVVTLLRVVHPYWEPDDAITDDDIEAMGAMDYLAEVRQRDELADVASSAAIAVGAVVPAIFRAAQEEDADLIVLCQHQRTPLARWARSWTGSEIAQQVARRASVPVLVLHEEDRVAAADRAALMTARC